MAVEPPIASAEDLSQAMAAISATVAAGELTLAEGFDLARLADSFLRVIDARNMERLYKAQTASFAQAERPPR